MTKSVDHLGQLSHLMQVKFETETASLRRLSRKEVELQQALAALGEKRYRADPSAATPAALLIGADLAWEKWAEVRKKALNIELARVRALKAAQKNIATRAFGRVEASKELVGREVLVAKQEAARTRNDQLADLIVTQIVGRS